MRTRVVSPSTLKVSASSTAIASLNWPRMCAYMSRCSYMQYTSGRQPGEHGEHPLVIGLVPRVVHHFAVPHDPVGIEDEDRPLRDALEPDHVRVEHPVIADGLLVEVAEQ